VFTREPSWSIHTVGTSTTRQPRPWPAAKLVGLVVHVLIDGGHAEIECGAGLMRRVAQFDHRGTCALPEMRRQATQALDNVETSLSKKIQEKQIKDRLAAGADDNAPAGYEKQVDSYFKAIAGKKKP